MPRYIDAEKIEWHEQLEPLGNGKYEYCRVAYMDDIDEIPTADVRENVRGEWIVNNEPNGEFNWECSNCKEEINWIDVQFMYGGVASKPYKPNLRFCPNCGAEMRDKP